MSYREVYEKYYLSIYTVCKFFLKDEKAAEDAAQETFIKLIPKWEGLTDRDNLGAWLRRVALNTCKDMIRKREREIPFETIYMEAPEADMGKELMAEAMALVKEFKPKYREIFRLALLEGRSNREIAELLRVPVTTVEGRIRICLQKLRRALG